MDFSLRPATEADAASIVKLLNPIIEAGTYTIMAEPLSVEQQTGWIRSVTARGVFQVAARDDDDDILGFQCVEPISAIEPAWKHVGDVATFVALGAQRQGIGSNLSESTWQKSQEQGFSKITATIRADNLAAIAFYRSLGFHVVGTLRKHALVRGEYLDEVLAEKLLDESAEGI